MRAPPGHWSGGPALLSCPFLMPASLSSTCDHCPVGAQVWQLAPEDAMPGELIRGGGLHWGQARTAGLPLLLYQHHGHALQQPIVLKHVRTQIKELVGKPGRQRPECGERWLLTPGPVWVASPHTQGYCGPGKLPVTPHPTPSVQAGNCACLGSLMSCITHCRRGCDLC